MKKSKSTNPVLLGLIEELKKKAHAEDAPIWRSLAKSLTGSSSRKAQVNISRIARYTEKGDVVAVPGKVLGAGTIAYPVTVAAFNFSKQAREKILSAGGRCISLRDLTSEFPKGSNVKIIK
ncbi:MAG: 50S ribosomal protein L18e [Methanobacteriota archaeon]